MNLETFSLKFSFYKDRVKSERYLKKAKSNKKSDLLFCALFCSFGKERKSKSLLVALLVKIERANRSLSPRKSLFLKRPNIYQKKVKNSEFRDIFS